MDRTGLDTLRRHLAAGEMRNVREVLLRLDDESLARLRERLGEARVARLMRSAGAARRGWRGRVVAIHGIMGGKLAVREGGDEDLVWLNVLRLAAGRIADFALDGHDAPAKPGLEVVSCGLLDEYLPLLVELDGTWQVKPFAFDWRLDIGAAADRLDATIREWANGEPVHIVAHSMGGLVARSFIRRHPDTWAAMADANGLRSGGRLVMLGTPNHGSFAIPLVLTGEEGLVKTIARLDLRHAMPALLGIIGTFTGCYQMLPSPALEFGDERRRLYRQDTWGSFPVAQARLDAGAAFHESIRDAVDPARMVYVAGYDQPTPHRLRVKGPGDFEYRETRLGDGRVPHELGRLEGVRTFYVDEVHGDLPKNERVLAGLHELLQSGETPTLRTEVPGGVRGAEGPWRGASEVAPPPAPVPAPSRGAMPPRVQEATERELASYFNGGLPRRGGTGPAKAPPPAAPKAAPAKRRRLVLEIAWGDIASAPGDAYCAGHYQGVLPMRGEAVLDAMVSGDVPAAQRAIHGATKRGQLRAQVGDVEIFPTLRPAGRTVAIAGMGGAGTFGREEARRLARAVVERVGSLPRVRTLNTLLIGAGVGNLPLGVALEAFLAGVHDVLSQDGDVPGLARIRIVERDRTTAERILAALGPALAAIRNRHPGRFPFTTPGKLQLLRGGTYGEAAVSRALVAAVARQPGGPRGAAARKLLRALPDAPMREAAAALLDDSARVGVLQAALGQKPANASGPEAPARTLRISYASDAAGARVAAITETAVVPERLVAFDARLLDDLVRDMTDGADLDGLERNAALLAGFLVPADFRASLQESASTLIEVDRTMARVPWELLGRLDEAAGTGGFLALSGCVARQLRTTYSLPPSSAPAPAGRLRALVVGDPGRGPWALPQARREAHDVQAVLEAAGVEVVLLLGPARADGSGDTVGVRPASILEVLRQLATRFDILHFAGHGDFDPADRTRAGWVFEDGRFFTARELAAARHIPRLVVANACLTAPVAQDLEAARPDAALLPGLADEFFRRGVRNYIGTAWPVNDVGAVEFARVFYRALTGGEGTTSTGAALRDAREALRPHQDRFGLLWAAYQHYGDPGFVLRTGEAQAPDTAKRPRGRR